MAYNLMPDSIRKQLPKLYSTEKELIGDKVAYARYFFPMGAYTAYLLEYDPKSRIGFGAVTMGYGWELGNMSLDEMEGVKVRGLGIERDLYFSPKKLHEIAELEEVVRGQYTKEEVVAEEIKEEVVTKQRINDKVKETVAVASENDTQIMEDTISGGKTTPSQPLIRVRPTTISIRTAFYNYRTCTRRRTRLDTSSSIRAGTTGNPYGY